MPNYISPNFQNCLTQVARHLRRVEPARDSRRLQRSPQHPHVHPGVQRSVRTESISQQISLNMIFCRHHKQGWANERLLSCENILLGWVWWYIAKQDLGPFFHSCLYAWWKRLALGCVNITQPRVQLSNHPCLYVKSDLIIGTVRVSTSFSRRARPWPAPPSWASCSASCRRSRPAKEGQLRIWKLTQHLTKDFWTADSNQSVYSRNFWPRFSDSRVMLHILCRTLVMQAIHQLVALAITLLIAIVAGSVTGDLQQISWKMWSPGCVIQSDSIFWPRSRDQAT